MNSNQECHLSSLLNAIRQEVPPQPKRSYDEVVISDDSPDDDDDDDDDKGKNSVRRSRNNEKKVIPDIWDSDEEPICIESDDAIDFLNVPELELKFSCKFEGSFDGFEPSGPTVCKSEYLETGLDSNGPGTSVRYGAICKTDPPEISSDINNPGTSLRCNAICKSESPDTSLDSSETRTSFQCAAFCKSEPPEISLDNSEPSTSFRCDAICKSEPPATSLEHNEPGISFQPKLADGDTKQGNDEDNMMIEESDDLVGPFMDAVPDDFEDYDDDVIFLDYIAPNISKLHNCGVDEVSDFFNKLHSKSEQMNDLSVTVKTGWLSTLNCLNSPF